MITHEQIWRAIDALAKREGLSVSALAKRAGLDATTFNKSKRITAKGRPRWPSSESLAKILSCTNTTLDEFAALMRTSHRRYVRVRIPLIGLAQAGGGGLFDDGGFPVGGGWEEIDCPGVADENAYALRITGQSMEPVYRAGDVIIVSPNSQVRPGDRVVVRLTGGEVMAKLLRRRTAKHVELVSFNPAHPPRREPLERIHWMARILWVSQ
ncbi:MAG TPA: helix-turn-helix transcriptional regulator [Thermopetrobacter sp.]|nr:helix-turn-helix transcriptional regulator [Thermopetrobacter sp.]